MTFEEWFEKEGKKFITPYSLAMAAWDAAKEDAMPVADIFHVDYMCSGFVINGGPYWTVRGTPATVICKTKEEAQQWAIKNGYRIKNTEV